MRHSDQAGNFQTGIKKITLANNEGFGFEFRQEEDNNLRALPPLLEPQLSKLAKPIQPQKQFRCSDGKKYDPNNFIAQKLKIHDQKPELFVISALGPNEVQHLAEILIFDRSYVYPVNWFIVLSDIGCHDIFLRIGPSTRFFVCCLSFTEMDICF